MRWVCFPRNSEEAVLRERGCVARWRPLVVLKAEGDGARQVANHGAEFVHILAASRVLLIVSGAKVTDDQAGVKACAIAGLAVHGDALDHDGLCRLVLLPRQACGDGARGHACAALGPRTLAGPLHDSASVRGVPSLPSSSNVSSTVRGASKISVSGRLTFFSTWATMCVFMRAKLRS